MPIEGQFILVIDPSPETAARVNSRLRNSGLSVQVLHADSRHEAERLCREFRPALLAWAPASAEAIGLADAARLARDTQAFFAVMAEAETAARLAPELLREGCLLIDTADDGSMVEVTGRILELRKAAHERSSNQDDLNDLRGQLSLVLESMRDPVAYFHEGLHVAANAAYLQAVGADSFAELEGASLLELIGCEDRDLKQLVREFGDGQFPDAPLEGRLLARNGEPRPARFRFDPIRLHQEDCVQMLVLSTADEPAGHDASEPAETGVEATAAHDLAGDEDRAGAEPAAEPDDGPSDILETHWAQPVPVAGGETTTTVEFSTGEAGRSDPAPEQREEPLPETVDESTPAEDTRDASSAAHGSEDEAPASAGAEPGTTGDTGSEPKAADAGTASGPRVSEAGAAELDPVTGLHFRADFVNRVDAGIDDIDGKQRGAVIFLRPDGVDASFEDLTVTEMDDYVRGMAERVGKQLSDAEFACRFADTAFAVFALRDSLKDVEQLAERLRDAVKRVPAALELRGLPVACSVGFALLDPFSQDAETVLAHAREAWRGAAEQGDAVLRYKPARGTLPTEDQEAAWVQRIRYALENEDFFTIQHAIMNLEGDSESLHENRTVLHEDDADVGAPDYQPTAERSGLASRIDRHVIPGLLRAVSKGDDRQIVSISGNSLQDFSFPSWFRRQLQESGIDGSRVFLQVDAAAARDHNKAARRLMEELGSTGVGFTLSNMDDNARKLSLIGALNPALVRLSTDLTDELGQHSAQVDRIRQVVREANQHSCLVYVGDVENSSDLALLWQCGVKMVSGDFLEGKHRVIGA